MDRTLPIVDWVPNARVRKSVPDRSQSDRAVPVLLISLGLLVLATPSVLMLPSMAVVWVLKRLLPGHVPVVHGPISEETL